MFLSCVVFVGITDQEDGQDCVEAPAAQATSCKMNPPCAACNKSVYPVEKLRCLDKVALPFIVFILLVRGERLSEWYM